MYSCPGAVIFAFHVLPTQSTHSPRPTAAESRAAQPEPTQAVLMDSTHQATSAITQVLPDSERPTQQLPSTSISDTPRSTSSTARSVEGASSVESASVSAPCALGGVVHIHVGDCRSEPHLVEECVQRVREAFPNAPVRYIYLDTTYEA